MSTIVIGFDKVKIIRDVNVPLFRFIDYFKGFEKIEAVIRLFGDETEKVLNELWIEFRSRRGYMGVNDQDGHLIINAEYLRNGDARDIYLDIIHELVHVKQFMDGKQLRDRRFNYVERPTEIEAYRHTVEEAKNIGMTTKQIFEYLKTESMTDDDAMKLANVLGIGYLH